MTVRNTDPATSHESAAALGALAGKLRARVVQLARAVGRHGITLSEAAAAIPEHKPASITPRFIELIERGQLVRVRVGTGKPTKRFPAGQPRYMTRFDEQTKRNVLIHWVPEFGPSPEENEQSGQAALFAGATI
ncbi:MAG: hypothetical protein ABR920_08605 [Terriglobales bacterium]